MNDTLSKQALSLAKWAPILLIFNGHWMLSNRQIFLNEWSYIQDENAPMPSGHFFPLDLELNWDTPAYIFSFASLILLVIQGFLGTAGL